MQIQEIERKIQQSKGKLDHIKSSLKRTEESILMNEKDASEITEAQAIIQQVASETQNSFVCRISDTVATALDSVFGDDAYDFEIEFVQKAGKTEVEFSFIRDGNKVDPLSSSGGGAVDIAAFALRVAVWSILKNSGRKVLDTIILDEPFRFLSRDLQPLAGKMMKMLSEKLGVQFIVVTHNQDLIDNADALFDVSKKNGESFVKRLGGSVCG